MKTSFKFSKVAEFIRNLPARLFMVILSILVLYPLIWNVISSLKSNTEILESPWSLPAQPQWQNYVNAFEKANMGSYFLNSVIVVAVGTVLLLVLSIPITYVLVRYRFPGSKLLFSVLMACIFIQEPYILVPLFLQLNAIHLLDSLVVLGVVYATVRLPFTVFLLSGFIRSIPVDYEQAAMLDGCGYFKILWRIIVPLAKPGIFTAGLLAALGYWNEYAIALTLITSETKQTLPVGLVNLYEVQRYATDWGALFAALVIVLVPSVCAYIFAQERLTQGMSIGGIKE